MTLLSLLFVAGQDIKTNPSAVAISGRSRANPHTPAKYKTADIEEWVATVRWKRGVSASNH